MASKIEICNLAVVKLGALRITSLEDNTKSANVLSAVYDSLLDAELASHPWSFATTRAQIPADVAAPSFGWGYRYQLPAGFLKMVEVGQDWLFYDSDQGPVFTIEGGAVLTDQLSPLQIRYVQRVTNAGLFPAMFVQSFACRLAYETAESLTQSLSKRQQAIEEYKETIRIAKRNNDIEKPPQRNAPQSWERSLYQVEG
jgi:hypothetical protein